MYGEQEVFFNCPYCFEHISFLLETTHGAQSYIEDCEVCCKPIDMSYQITEGEVSQIDAKRAQ